MSVAISVRNLFRYFGPLKAAIGPVGPREWEGPYWWGQRLGLFLGSLAATGGFLLMGREALAEKLGSRSNKPEGKGER